jgi:hypothetical protein
MARRRRIILLLLLFVLSAAGMFFLPAIPQDPAYHDFADKRMLFGIPNFGDVSGNAVFVIVGLAGMVRAWGGRQAGENGWLVFFLGIFLTGFGSAYYHLAPDNQRLVWDRLPMTMAFMALFSALVSERIDEKAGRALLPVLLAAGMASVAYWIWTENLGHGDLRAYGYVQFFPMLEILLVLCLFPARHQATKYLAWTFACYVSAKFFEHFDKGFFALTGDLVSGHTLKHLVAAAGTACMIRYMQETRRTDA